MGVGVGVRRSETPHEVGVKLAQPHSKRETVRLSDFLVVNYCGEYPFGCNKFPFTSATGVTLTVTGLLPVTDEVANKVVKPTLLNINLVYSIVLLHSINSTSVLVVPPSLVNAIVPDAAALP